MKREDRDLDREGDEEGERGQPEGGGVARDAVGGGELGEVGKLEGAGASVDPEHADEQDCRGDEGVEEVFDGGAAAVDGAPEGGDEERHRDQRKLPEGVIEEEVERDEDAEHRDLLEQEEGVEEFLAIADRVPGDEDAEGGEEAGEHDEPHREAVDAEVVADGGRGDPLVVLLELEGACCGAVVVAEGKMQRQGEGDEGDGERAPLHHLALVGQQGQQDRARERDEGDDGQDGVVDVHRFLW